MSIGTLASVLERMTAIESRFNRPSPPMRSSVETSPAADDGFDAILDRQAAPVSAVAADDAPVGAPSTRPAVHATPIAPGTAGVPGLHGGLDQLAAMGLLASSGGAFPGVGSHLDRLAAVGALPAGGTGHGGIVAHGVPYGTAVGGGATIAAPGETHRRTLGGVSMDTPFAAEFERAGFRHGVPPRLLAAVGWVESRYQVDAISPDGAIGVMQIMPMTAQELGVDPHDPIDAIDGAARLLAQHQRRFGSWDLALAAYHSGGGAVSRNGNQPPPRAAAYVERIHDRLENS